MKKLFSVTAIIFLFAAGLSAQEEASQAKWQANKILIDGNVNDWDHPFNLFDYQSGLLFTLGNDHKMLYLCFTTHEQVKAEKLMKAGWTLRILSSEKNRKFDVSIAFPKTGGISANLKSEFKNEVGLYKMNLLSVNTKGFLTNNGEAPLVNNNGINIGIGLDDAQQIIYEIAIPIKELIQEDKLQLNELISLDITVNALGKQEAGQTVASTKYGSGGGRMGIGGRKTGRSSFAERDNAATQKFNLFDKVNFKQKFRLSNQ